MISYEIYKMLHIFSIVFMFSFFGIQAFGANQKMIKIFAGIFSFLIFVSGMGLIARIGIGHGESWPLWIKLKIALWFLIAVGSPIVLKRFRAAGKQWYSFTYILLLAILYIVQYRVA